MTLTSGARPWGVVLAGGSGTRLGAVKPLTNLAGVPLYLRVASAMNEAGLRVAVITKPAFRLGAAVEASNEALEIKVVEEPDEPVHPLLGILTALEELREPVVVCACDMPFVPAALLDWLSREDGHDALVCTAGGHLQPLLGRYEPASVLELRDAIAAGRSSRSVIEALGEGARVVSEGELSRFGDTSRLLFDIDTPGDLAEAERILATDES